MHSAADYQEALLKLLPRGRAWSRDPNSVQGCVLGAFADGLARLEARALQLVQVEADPRTTVELLPEWETEFGLPDPCAGDNPALAQRRASVIARRTDTGGLSIEHITDVAAALGYQITITEFDPWTCNSSCTDSLYDQLWTFVWQVNAPATTIRYFDANSACTEPLASWGNAVLECEIRRIAQSHTFTLFAYGS